MKNRIGVLRGGVMVSSLSAEEIGKSFPNIVDILRYHIATGRYSYADRIAAAMDSRIVEETIREALRAALTAASSVKRGNFRRVELETGKVLEDRVEVTYVEAEDVSDPKQIPGRIFLHGGIYYDEGERKFKACFYQPFIPSEDEMAQFMDKVREDIELAHKVASLAMTRHRR